MQSIDIMQTEIINYREIASDIMIRPPVEVYSSRAFTNIEEIIALGEEEAKKHLVLIKKVIKEWKGQGF
jgi:NTE family protein